MVDKLEEAKQDGTTKKQKSLKWKDAKKELTELADKFSKDRDPDRFVKDATEFGKKIADGLSDDYQILKFVEKGSELLDDVPDEVIRKIIENLSKEFLGYDLDKKDRRNFLANYLFFCKIDYELGCHLLLPSHKAISDDLERIASASSQLLNALDEAMPAAKILLNYLLFKFQTPLSKPLTVKEKLSVIKWYDLIWEEEEDFHASLGIIGAFLSAYRAAQLGSYIQKLHNAAGKISEIVGTKTIGRPPRTKLHKRLIRRLGAGFDALTFLIFYKEIKSAGGWPKYCEKSASNPEKGKSKVDVAKDLGRYRAKFVEIALKHLKIRFKGRNEIYRILGRRFDFNKAIGS